MTTTFWNNAVDGNWETAAEWSAETIRLHGGHTGDDIALAHDAAEAPHTHDPAFVDFVHDLLLNHAMPEAFG
jgi:hypothetical protein